MDLRKAIKMAGSIFLLKSHVKEHQRRSKSGAITQVSSYETSRQAAEAASKKANDHQAKQDWNKPDTKGGAKLHAEAGLKHVSAMHEAFKAGDSESMRNHYYKASHHLASVDHHLSFNPKDKKARAAHAEKIADALSQVANAHKTEHNHRSLDYGSSIHLLAAEHHNRAASANYNINSDEKGQKHREEAIRHGKKASEIAGVAVEASEHAWNASDRARIGGDKPEHHLDAMRAHRKAAALDFDSEGRAEHEKAAKEHGDKAVAKIGAVKQEADSASNKADESGTADDHKAAMEKHQAAAKSQPEHLRRYHKEMAEYHGKEAAKSTQGKPGKDQHPNVIGHAEKMDDKEAVNATSYQFDGKKNYSTGKKGKSMHDDTPVREFEHEESGHRTWLDDKGRVHADSKEEAKQYREKKSRIKKSYAGQLMDLAKSHQR